MEQATTTVLANINAPLDHLGGDLGRSGLLAARMAGRKGHSFFLYFVFGLVFFPLALLVAYMVHHRSSPTA